MRHSLPSQNYSPNFIGSWLIDHPSLCDDLVAHFELNNTKHKKGYASTSSTAKLKDLSAKNSIDLTLSPKELLLPPNRCFQTYFQILFEFYSDYTMQWPFLKGLASEVEIGRFNIQRYQKGQHFQKIHTERSGISTLHRLFAWMTYLNDVLPEDGGSTIFTHYGIEIQPQKGLTLIWPAEWTHAHKGSILTNNAKYIITGWMHFAS